MIARQLRTAQEQTRYKVAVVFSAIVWLALLVSLVGAAYGVFIAAFIAIAHALFLAHVQGSGVRLGPDQLPHLWRRVVAASEKLGLEQPPETYVLQSGGVLNAFATKLFSRRFVILYSELVHACEEVSPSLDAPDSRPTELDFVIAHEIGHIACGHLNWFVLPARVMPLLGPAYSRACEYTCDACGHAVTNDIEVSSRALAILAAGGLLGKRVNLDAFVGQRATAGDFWMSIYELNASHPYLAKRIAALRERNRPGWAPVQERNPLAYPLAPFLGFAGGGSAGMTVVFVIAIMAAVAVPAFQKYIERSKAIAALHPAPDADLDSALSPSKDKPSREAWIEGDAFDWRIRPPSPRWRLMPSEQAHKLNAVADRWITRADKDSHIIVIPEAAGGGITLDAYKKAVLDNARKAATDFQIVDDKPFMFGARSGRLIHTRGRVNGMDMDWLYGLLVTDDLAFQVLGFSAQRTFPSVQAEMTSALGSFEPLEAAAEQVAPE